MLYSNDVVVYAYFSVVLVLGADFFCIFVIFLCSVVSRLEIEMYCALLYVNVIRRMFAQTRQRTVDRFTDALPAMEFVYCK